MTTDSKFNLDEIRELIELLKETGMNEIEVSHEGASVRVRQQAENSVPTQVAVAAPALATNANNAQAETAESSVISGHVVEAPMIGTFYRSSSPEADSFVNVGDKVKKGQTICIIEAMKTFNNIEADCDGVIKSIQVENATPVEYGQPLFIIE